MQNLKNIANEIRIELVKLHNRSNTSHIGSEFSALDIMIELYYEVMNINPNNFSSKDRDYFILSKGHAAPALYAILYRRGFITRQVLEAYGSNGSILAEHPSRDIHGVDTISGSLGHGLSIGSGIAFALKNSNLKGKVYVLLSDGECEEGSTIEAANFAGRMNLDNIIAIIDNNELQAYEITSNIQNINSVKDKFRSSGWAIKTVNGHDYVKLKTVFYSTPFEVNKPLLVIANTVKGKGVKAMEGKMEWHYKSPSDFDAEKFIRELED